VVPLLCILSVKARLLIKLVDNKTVSTVTLPYLMKGFSGVMMKGEPASPHPEDCTSGLASAAAPHQNNGGGGVRVIFNDVLLRWGHSEWEIHLSIIHILLATEQCRVTMACSLPVCQQNHESGLASTAGDSCLGGSSVNI